MAAVFGISNAESSGSRNEALVTLLQTRLIQSIQRFPKLFRTCRPKRNA